MREILVLTSAYARPSVLTYKLWGRGRGTPRQPDGGRKMPSFPVAGCFWATSVFLGRKSHDYRRFKKRGFFKSLSLFSKMIVRQYWSFELETEYLISINGKKKNTQLSFWWKTDEKFKLRDLPSRTSSLLCSAAKQKHFVNQKVVNHNCNKREIETYQCEELTSSEMRREPRADRLQRHIAWVLSIWQRFRRQM